MAWTPEDEAELRQLKDKTKIELKDTAVGVQTQQMAAAVLNLFDALSSGKVGKFAEAIRKRQSQEAASNSEP